MRPSGNLPTFRPEDGGILDVWDARYGRDWLFVAGFDEWHAWTGTHWQPAAGLALNAQIEALLDALNAQARASARAAPNKAKREVARADVAATRRTAGRVASVEAMARARRFVPAGQLDAAGLLNLANGSLD
ncbi:MAG: hypothetical protein ACRDHL_05330, partial [Candidatus Promineifilaceae bacterium]